MALLSLLIYPLTKNSLLFAIKRFLENLIPEGEGLEDIVSGTSQEI